ncbi:MAG: hypothetical protein ACAH83_04360 [Alphaproteobacteria bacterium]
MFFSKDRAAKKAAVAAVRQGILDDADRRIAEASTVADPGEKILLLQKLKADLEKSVKEISDAADESSRLRGVFTLGGGLVGTVVGAIWATTALSNPWLLLLMLPGFWGTVKGAASITESKEARLREENKGFFSAMSVRKAGAAKICNELIESDWATIAKSPKVSEIFQAAPSLRERFAAAFCKGVVVGDIKAPQPPAPQPEKPAHSFQL